MQCSISNCQKTPKIPARLRTTFFKMFTLNESVTLFYEIYLSANCHMLQTWKWLVFLTFSTACEENVWDKNGYDSHILFDELLENCGSFHNFCALGCTFMEASIHNLFQVKKTLIAIECRSVCNSRRPTDTLSFWWSNRSWKEWVHAPAGLSTTKEKLLTRTGNIMRGYDTYLNSTSDLVGTLMEPEGHGTCPMPLGQILVPESWL